MIEVQEVIDTITKKKEQYYSTLTQRAAEWSADQRGYQLGKLAACEELLRVFKPLL
jgi:hypothetical protein